MTFQLIRSKNAPHLLYVIFITDIGTFQATVDRPDLLLIQEHCDQVVIDEQETYEVITLTPKAPAPAPEKETTP